MPVQLKTSGHNVLWFCLIVQLAGFLSRLCAGAEPVQMWETQKQKWRRGFAIGSLAPRNKISTY